MAQLMTEAERKEFKDVIQKMANQQINKLEASDPFWKERVEEAKKKRAIGHLKIEKDLVQLETVKGQIAKLEEQEKAIEERIKAKLPMEERDKQYPNSCPSKMSTCKAIGYISEKLHSDVMSKDKTGKEVLKIREKCTRQLADLTGCKTRDEIRERILEA